MPAKRPVARHVILLVCALVASTLALSVHAHAQTYPVDDGSFDQVSPTVRQGGAASMSGCGFAPGANIDVTLGGSSVGSAVADASGCFSASFQIRSAVAPGSSELRAVGASPTGTNVLSATVSVSPADPAGASSESAPTLLARTGRATLPTLAIAAALGLAGLVVVQLSRRIRTG